MVGIVELNTEQVERYLNEAAASKTVVKLPLFINNEYAADKITAVISDLAKSGGESILDVIVSSPSVMAHTRIDGHDKAKLCGALIDALHHDIMPYTTVIVSVPKAAKQALAEICKSHGFSDVL